MDEWNGKERRGSNWSHGLRIIIFSVSLIALLITSLVFNMLSNRADIDSVKHHFNESQLNIANETSKLIEDKVSDISDSLELLSKDLSTQRLDKNGENTAFLTALSQADYCKAIWHINQNGSVFNVVPKYYFALNKNDGNSCKSILKTYSYDKDFVDSTMGDILIDKHSNNIVTHIYKPVWDTRQDSHYKDPSNEFRGMLGFTLDLNELTGDIVKKIKSDGNGYGILVSQNTVIYHPHDDIRGSFLSEYIKSEPNFKDPIQKAFSGGSGVCRLMGSDGNYYLIAYSKVKVPMDTWAILIICNEKGMLEHYLPSALGKYENQFWLVVVFIMLCIGAIIHHFGYKKANDEIISQRKEILSNIVPVNFDKNIPCWVYRKCSEEKKETCPVFPEHGFDCWAVKNSPDCEKCEFLRKIQTEVKNVITEV